MRDRVADLREPTATVTKKDLRNIVRDFELDPCRGHSNDAVSVEIWFEKISNNVTDPSQSPVLHYKRQGEKSHIIHDAINADVNDDPVPDDTNNIILVISTIFQRQMLREFGQNIVCIDSTHGTNGYDFYLTTLMIVDEYGAGVPGAFCISNKKDAATWSVFFQKLKEHSDIGTLKPNVFMTDDDESFYIAWCQVFGPVQHRLLCTWHVDRNWRKNVLSLIKTPTKRVEVYKALQILQKEVNIEAFQNLMRGFVLELNKDQDTAHFGKYFQSYYQNRASVWAYCYRRNCKINTNMRLESFHKVFKYFFLHGRKNKRLDRCIDALLRLVRESFFRRVRKKSKNERPAKLQNIKRSHNVIVEDVQKTEIFHIWSVKSQTNKTLRYEVEQILENIEVCSIDCLTICEDCIPRICIHTFSCECVDYLIKANICKHIHAVVLQNTEIPVADITPATNTETENILDSLNEIFEGSASRPSTIETVKAEIEVLRGYLQRSEHNPEDECSKELLQKLSKMVSQCLDIGFKLANRTAPKQASEPAEPANKRLQCQPRFYSTKKKNTSHDKSLKKPENMERNVLKKFLFNSTLEDIENIETIHSGFDHTYR